MRSGEPTARVADEIAQTVRSKGTRLAFGHPGGEVVVLIDALRKSGMRFVLTHHETTAGFAAAGYAEFTGLPGICVSTLGPGATNLVTGTASALLERAPIISFTGSLAESAPNGATHQDLPLNDLFKTISKGSFHLGRSGPGADTERGLMLALEERPGPVHFSLAADVAESPSLPVRAETASTTSERQSDSAVALNLDGALSLIAASSKPAIITGLTAARQRAEEPLRLLAHQLNAPVALTPKAKGVVPEGDPLFLGVLDMAGDKLIGEFLDDADLIIAVGCDVVELDRAWTWEAPVLHIDGMPNIDGYYNSALELSGSIGSILAQLAENVARSDWSTEDIKKARADVLGHVRPPSASLQPWQVVEITQAQMGPETIATCDVGAHKMIVGQLWDTSSPRSFFMANGLSSMGYAVPTAMAISLAKPDANVVAFLGDGGLGMYLGELETLVRVGANLTMVVFADRSLELIARAEKRRGVDTQSVSFNNPDFDSLAGAFGIDTYQVGSVEDLDRALVDSEDSPGIRLIAAHIDGSDYQL